MKSFLPLIKDEWRLLLFGFAMSFGSSFGQTYFIGLFSGEIRADLGLSHGDFGAIYSAATLASAVILLWSGTLVDRINLRRFSQWVVLGLAAGCLLMASSRGLVALFLSMLVLRHLGQGLMSMAGTTAMVRYLDHQRGKANALGGIGYSVSEATLPTLVIASLALLNWRQSWIFWALMLMVTMPLLIRWLLRDHDQRHSQYLRNISADTAAPSHSLQKQWSRPEVLRDPFFYCFIPVLVAMPLLFTGFMFHQVHLVDAKGWSLGAWGGLYILYAGVSMAFKLWTGVIIDRVGALNVTPLICIPFAVGLVALASASQFEVAVAFMVLMGMSSTVSPPFYAEMYGTQHLGSIKSVTTATMVFASAVSPVVMGWLIDIGVSMNTMALGGALYIMSATGLALVSLVKLKKLKKQDIR
jgi:MFS family permease